MNAPRYNHERHANGEVSSLVPGWIVTYPATCNGIVRDLAFIASRGYGGSDFIHFDVTTGEPYGFPMTQAARARLVAMRQDFRP